MPAPGYFGRFNPDLLSLIPPDAKTVLEIGCGEGALCAEYRKRNPGVEWWGVEANGKSAAAARKSPLDFICYSDAEGDGIAYGCNSLHEWRHCENADCLILGDVLEHLEDPWTTLSELVRRSLLPGAQVLASIPNVQHWTVIRDLLAGKWEYQDEGLMDRTHLRFFTLDSIKAMFKQAGLHVHEIRGRDICNEDFEDWLSESGVKSQKEMRAYQYIVRAVKPCLQYEPKRHHFEMPCLKPFSIDKLHIHAVTAEECCARPRIRDPFAFMATEPGVTCTTQDRSPGAIRDILIQQRMRDFDLDYQRNRLTKCIVVAELDDEPEFISVDPMALRAVHAVQVSTEPLAEIARQWNPNVMVFPNQIAELPALREFKETTGITIFYGAQNRQADWVPIMPALNRVLKDYASGPVRIFVHVIHDREFFDALELTESDELEVSQKLFDPFLDYESYRFCLKCSDIALLPLESSRFNECKSDIKFLECAAEGVVVLAGETVYGDSVCHPSRGHVYISEASFEGNLRFLISNPQVRVDLAKEAYAYVRECRMLSGHYKRQLEWYRELLRTKPDLDRQLLERVPELRLQHALAATPA